MNTVDKTFTGWPTIEPANADATYVALYTTNNSNAGVSLTLSQTTNAGQGVTSIDLTSTGGLDWAAWDGGSSTPTQSMAGGSGFSGFSPIGNSSFGNGFFNGQNSYSWTNGQETIADSTTLAGNATFSSNGDGARLTINISNAGSYQLKFYASTYDVNLIATATLQSKDLSHSASGTYIRSSVEKYEYTVDFTTEGADTLTLDVVKSDGANSIFAQEAFSLKALSTVPPTTINTYDITFINVDNSQTVQTVNENEVATPPDGVNTTDKTFTGWPTVLPATANATYTAHYETNTPNDPDGNTDQEKNPPISITAIWDDEANDNLWTSLLNWQGDIPPTLEDNVYIGNSELVKGAKADFASIYIDSDSYVSFSDFYPNNKIFNINGTLDLDSVSAFRPYGSYLHLTSTGKFGSSVQWLDLGTNSILSFADGAYFESYTAIEVRGTVSFDFELSESGFTALNLGGLYDGNVSRGNESNWSDFTFNIDISKYDLAHGSEIILIDFSSHSSSFSYNFNPARVNIIKGSGSLNATLDFDKNQSKLILTIFNEE